VTPPTETASEQIAGDLALAIHKGLIRPGEQLPSQTHLMRSYDVAMGTAASALRKLVAVGLVRTERGRGAYAVDQDRLFRRAPILDVLAAASVLRHLAARTFGGNAGPPTVEVGGSRDWDDPHADPEKTMPPRRVDVSALAALDRNVLRWMSEALLTEARRLAGAGDVVPSDDHLLLTARSILHEGGRRPERQPGIAWDGGPIPAAEDVAFRIWPERRRPLGAGSDSGDDVPPF